MRSPLILLALGVVLGQAVAAVPTMEGPVLLRPQDGTIAVHQLCEWLLSTLPAESPRPTLRIRDPEGALVLRPAFHYREHRSGDPAADEAELVALGDVHWRFRHSFRQPGPHSLELRDGGDQTLWRSIVEVTERDSGPGPIRVSTRQRRLLAQADGSPFIAIGPNLAWATGTNRLAAMSRMLQRLAEAGGNHIRLWTCSWYGQIEGDAPDRYRLDEAWLIDRSLDEARRLGIRVTLVLDNFHDLHTGRSFPYGANMAGRQDGFFQIPLPAQYQRRLDEVAARWAADDALLGWELFNEIDLALLGPDRKVRPDGRTLATRWSAAASAALRARDPDQRPIAMSLAREHWPEVYAAPEIDLIHVHSYVDPPQHLREQQKDLISLVQGAFAAVSALDKPVLLAETGFQGTNEHNPWHDRDRSGLLLRRAAWSGLLLGGYGSGKNWWWDVYIDRHDLWNIYRPLAETVRQLDWQDPELAPIAAQHAGQLLVIGWRSPRQALLWPRHREDSWHRRLVEDSTPPSSSSILRLGDMAPNSRFRVHVIDMATGQRKALKARESSAAGGLLLQLQGSENDRVLLVLPAD